MKSITYLGYYDVPENSSEDRNFVLSAVNKMNYICSAIKRNGYDVKLLSASGTRKKNNCFCKSKHLKIEDGVELDLLSCFGSSLRIIRLISIIFINIQLFFALLFSTKRGQPVLVYHSLGYMSVVKLVRRIKRFRLILEIEEIYGDVSQNVKTKNREMSFFRIADGYLFSTELLNKKINVDNKPNAIIYGTYTTENDSVMSDRIFDDNTIHCVYAGTFDPRKGGAQSAVRAAGCLPLGYHMHIIGFGSEADTEELVKLINTTSQYSAAKITYDGLLCGEDYVRFLSSCDIGLSTQIPYGIYNETSFPSKVLSYMANGLQVVSIRLRVLEESMIGEMIHYYETDSPDDIANTIINIDIKKAYDTKKELKALDECFVKSICALIE